MKGDGIGVGDADNVVSMTTKREGFVLSDDNVLRSRNGDLHPFTSVQMTVNCCGMCGMRVLDHGFSIHCHEQHGRTVVGEADGADDTKIIMCFSFIL